MKTPLQEMYDDVMSLKQKPLQYYLDLEKQHLITAYKTGNNEGFEGLKYEAEDYYQKMYNKRPQTTTVRPDISE
jgi:hypothetical protein